jgi:hypothetical protein
MELEDVLAVVRALNAAGVQYVIIGGVALNFHGLPRATADVDLFVSPSEENIASLRKALDSVFHDPELAEITAADLGGQYPAVQYVPPHGGFHLDILGRLGEAFAFADIESQVLDIDGVPVRVATPRMLHRMKRDTVRLQDKADAERLREHFDLDDREER